MGIVDSIKGFIGIDDEPQYDPDQGEYEPYEEEYDEKYEQQQGFSPSGRRSHAASVTPINTAPGRGSIAIIKIKKADESENLASILKSGRPAIFDVSEMEDKEEARRVVDFMTGAVFALDGTIKRVSAGIFLSVPNTMNITNDDVRRKANNSVNFEV